MSELVKVYFSFRSPYSWLALHRLETIIDELGIDFDYIPVFPPPGTLTAAETDKRKLSYIRQDIKRIAGAYGLKVSMPDPFDIRWLIPHSAFLYAKDAGKGLPFCNNLYLARFSEGENIATNDVLHKAAVACGLDGDELTKAGRDRHYHERVLSGMSNLADKGIFGVPTFFYDNSLYWGNDRLDWLIRSVFNKQGKPVSDLVEKPFDTPF